MEKRSCELCNTIFELQHKNQIGRFCSSLCNRKLLRKTQSDKWNNYLASETEEQKRALFKARFEKNIIRKKEGCWDFKILRNVNGYGRFTFRGKVLAAHRASWDLYNGEIPENMHVLHKCNNRKCVNPDHLYLGNHQDNMQDKANRLLIGANRKLTEKQVHEIKKLIDSGIPLFRIGKMYNVRENSIRCIKEKKTWRYLN